MRKAMVLPALLVLAGCAPNDPAVPTRLSATGQIRPRIDPAQPRRLVVEITNVRDLGGFDLEKAADRHTVVLSAFKPQCGAPAIQEERVTRIGEGALGHIPKIYTLVLDCPNGASQVVQ